VRRGLVLATSILAAVLVASRLDVGSAASLNLTSQAFTAVRTCTITAATTATTAVADANVRQGSATTNFGVATTVNVSSAASANQRIYLKFDVTQCSPAIPATATVRLATLRLFMSTVPTVCRTVDVFRVTAAWTESAITWNNQPFGTTINNPASGSADDTFAVGTATGCTNQAAGYVAGADVTTSVAAFVAGTSTNFGWMLRDDVEGSSTARTSTYSAKELATLARAPQLVVTYVLVP
jgi:hypothetical protein